jgi:broad specificity phosphatase PhoE
MHDLPIRTRFGLIRHAETFWNREKRVQGQTDSPLTPEGQEQADRWGRKLSRIPWDRILASDASRAAFTVERINAHLRLPVDTDTLLRELDWGRWTGLTVAEIRRQEPALVAEQEAAGWEFQPPGGESRRRQLERSRQALLKAARCWPGRSILVVTHGGTIKTLLHHVSGTHYTSADALTIDAYNLHWIDCTAGELRLHEMNAISLC